MMRRMKTGERFLGKLPLLISGSLQSRGQLLLDFPHGLAADTLVKLAKPFLEEPSIQNSPFTCSVSGSKSMS